MRLDDEIGPPCPATLGEYRDYCEAFGMENNAAIALLDERIATSPHGRDEPVLAPDSQMRQLLMPLMIRR